ncbi:DUF6355 family natural product biosynthesis protein [Streptomyces phaeochromogenes]|uniref:DUF6355 family natural product biosynthesis protein n=1 Tax=Streptomyces phaeochromogenes TaxID=1923 RepID=UPI00367CF87E
MTIVGPAHANPANTRDIPNGPFVSDGPGPSVKNPAPGSSEESPVTAALKCGYTDNSNGYAVYRHCGTYNVGIFVDSWGPLADYYLCVSPGNTTLGATWIVNNAYYVKGFEWCQT